MTATADRPGPGADPAAAARPSGAVPLQVSGGGPLPAHSVVPLPVRSAVPLPVRSAVPFPARSAVPLRVRSAVALAVVSAVGILAFAWPLLAGPASLLARTTQTPWLFALLLPLLLAVVLAEVGEGGLDARAVAMLGLLAAVGAALRPLGAGTAGIEPVFALLIPAGRVFGRGFGFVLGALTLLVSALLTAGVGPWLPFQMLGAAWIGFGAACLPRARGRAEVPLLAAYAVLAGLGYGLALDLSIWPYGATGIPALAYLPGAPVGDNVVHLLRFTVATSLGWDLLRGATLAVATLLAGRPVLLALRRAARRANFVPAGAPDEPDRGPPRRPALSPVATVLDRPG